MEPRHSHHPSINPDPIYRMEDQILTPHFKLSEFSNSPTAKAHGIDNTIPEAYIPKLKALCENVLEPLREHVQQPIAIGSGYRCPKLNTLVGGVKRSQHQFGEAADIHLPDEQTGREWFLWIMDNLQFDQLIWEKNSKTSTHHWIHVSYREASGEQGRTSHNRQHVIRNLTKHA